MHKFTHGDFLAGGEANLQIPELAATTSPSSITHTFFVECEICHVILKPVRDLGNHKRENHPPIVKQKVCYGTADQANPSPVSRGNKKPAPSPVLLPRQIPCPGCKIGCYNRKTLLGHVSAEHPSYKFMCNEANCFKANISKSGLFKHKRNHILQDSYDSVLCMDCQETFKCEDDCDNHQCPAQAPKPKQKKQPKIEPHENFKGGGEGSSGGKRNTRSTQIKKEK